MHYGDVGHPQSASPLLLPSVAVVADHRKAPVAIREIPFNDVDFMPQDGQVRLQYPATRRYWHSLSISFAARMDNRGNFAKAVTGNQEM